MAPSAAVSVYLLSSLEGFVKDSVGPKLDRIVLSVFCAAKVKSSALITVKDDFCLSCFSTPTAAASVSSSGFLVRRTTVTIVLCLP